MGGVTAREGCSSVIQQGAVSHHDNQLLIIDFWLKLESEKNDNLKTLDCPAGGLWSNSNKRHMEEKVDGVRNPRNHYRKNELKVKTVHFFTMYLYWSVHFFGC